MTPNQPPIHLTTRGPFSEVGAHIGVLFSFFSRVCLVVCEQILVYAFCHTDDLVLINHNSVLVDSFKNVKYDCPNLDTNPGLVLVNLDTKP